MRPAACSAVLISGFSISESGSKSHAMDIVFTGMGMGGGK